MNKYIVTVKDKKTKDILFELDVEAYKVQVSDSVAALHALIAESEDEEKSPNVFELDEECSHEWSTYLGLAFTDDICKICGAKNK